MFNIVEIGGKKYFKKFREYPLKLTRTAVANAVFTGSIQTEPSEAPFLLTSIHGEDTADGGTITTIVPWLVSVQDNQSAYYWADGYVPRLTMCGGREFGNQFPEEVPIRGNTRLTVSIQNPTAAPAAGDAYFTLRGWALIPLV